MAKRAIITGITTSVRELIRSAFAELGIELEFSGSGAAEVGRVLRCLDSRFLLPSGKVVVAVDKRYYRPTEVDLLVGDSTKIREKLGWAPEYSFASLVREMVAEDLDNVQRRNRAND